MMLPLANHLVSTLKKNGMSHAHSPYHTILSSAVYPFLEARGKNNCLVHAKNVFSLSLQHTAPTNPPNPF